jgi:hypothetical protein
MGGVRAALAALGCALVGCGEGRRPEDEECKSPYQNEARLPTASLKRNRNALRQCSKR